MQVHVSRHRCTKKHLLVSRTFTLRVHSIQLETIITKWYTYSSGNLDHLPVTTADAKSY